MEVAKRVWYPHRYGADGEITDEELYDDTTTPHYIQHSVYLNTVTCYDNDSTTCKIVASNVKQANNNRLTCSKGHDLLLCTNKEIKNIYGAGAICDYEDCGMELKNGGYHCDICPYDICKDCINKQKMQQSDEDYIPSEKISKQTKLTKLRRSTRISKTNSTNISKNTHRIGIIHPKLISNNIQNNLLKLIQPIQSNPYTYRDSCFLIRDGSNEYTKNKLEYYNKMKPKIQELINPYYNLHLQGYESFGKHRACKKNSIYDLIQSKQYNKILNRNILSKTVEWIPSIFEIKDNNTIDILTDIDSLPKVNNTELYDVIQNIFSKFLSSIEYVLNKDLKVNDKLYVYCKLQDYQFNNPYKYDSNWHVEGHHDIDHIKCVALYYFDIKTNNNLKLSENKLILNICSDNNNSNEFPINLKEGMCVVFDNVKTSHKVHIDVKRNNKDKNMSLSRKCIAFFIRDPEYTPNDYLNPKDLHFVNYSFKLNIIFNYWTKNKINIPYQVVMIINVFCGFDNGEHQQKMVSIMRKIHNPKWDRRLKVEEIIYFFKQKKQKPKPKPKYGGRSRRTARISSGGRIASRKSAPACGD